MSRDPHVRVTDPVSDVGAMDDAAPQAAGGPGSPAGTPLVVRSCAVCHTLYETPALGEASKAAEAAAVSGPERGRDRFCSKACRRLAQRQHRS